MGVGQNLGLVAAAFVGGILFWSVFLSIILLNNFLQLPRRIHRIYAQQKALHDLVEVTWTDAEIWMRSSHGNSTFKWSDFLKVYNNEKVVILLQSDALFNFIPVRALSDEQAASIIKYYKAAHGQ